MLDWHNICNPLYDESNNCRKFWVDDSKQQFNTDYTADFVLAGLVKKEGDTVDVSLETFRKPLKLQGNVEEIKFSKLYAKGDSVTLNTYTHMTFEDAQVELDRVANL